MDAGFKKIANALMLEARVGADVHRNVVFEKPSEGARWDAEDFRGPIVFYVTQGEFALRNVRPTSRPISRRSRCPGFGRRDQRKGTGRLRRARQGTIQSVGCEACHLVEPSSNGREPGPNLFGLFRPRSAHARSRRRRRGPSLPDQGQPRIPAPLGPFARADQLAVAESWPDARPGLSTGDAGVRDGDAQRSADRRASATTLRRSTIRQIAGRWSSSSTRPRDRV